MLAGAAGKKLAVLPGLATAPEADAVPAAGCITLVAVLLIVVLLLAPAPVRCVDEDAVGGAG